MLFDTVFFLAPFLTVYFVFTGMLEGRSLSEIYEKVGPPGSCGHLSSAFAPLCSL